MKFDVLKFIKNRSNRKPEAEMTEKQARISSLTQRESETLQFLLCGYTLKTTAELLGVRYPTANTFVNSIYKKLCVSSRAQLILEYREFYKGDKS